MEGIFRTQEGSFAQFKWEAVKNNYASEQQGRPIFDKALIATITSPGQSKSEIKYELERESHEGKTSKTQYYEKYRDEVEKWKSNNQSGDLQGTPIDQWPQIDVKMAATLKFNKIFTVEALCDVPDGGLQALGMGARELQAKAKAFLAASKDTAAVQKYAAENERLNDRVAELEKQIQDLSAKFEKKK